jgi:hypothetical protein
MTSGFIEPLRKRRKNGDVYKRLPEIEAEMVEIRALTREEISSRCAIQDPESAGYLPSECLLHLVREHRSRPFDECSQMLFKALMERVLRGLPKAESGDGMSERLADSNVRDGARHRFLAMLMKDRQEYVEGLDFYEVCFEKTLKTLRLDALRKANRKDNPLKSIDDPETGEIAEHVERAAGSFDQLDWRKFDDSDSLLSLDEAIDALPELEKAIIELDRKGIPIESKEPEVVNIANALGKTPKTIRKYRNKAYATLRKAVTKGEPR